MKSCITVLCIALLLCGVASAQSQGYFFFAPGQLRASGQSAFAMDIGGGGKFVSKSGLGAGAELGVVGPKDNYADSVFALFSLNGYYDFKPSGNVVPFVTGGYSRSFGHGSGANWGNFGGGVNYWFAKKAGMLLEFRDHLHRTNGVTLQLWTARFGITFR
jgi:hypothetical protein